MQFTGRNLQLIRDALDLAHAELHNQIATCPDVLLYEEDIEAIEAEQARLMRLMARIDRRQALTARRGDASARQQHRGDGAAPEAQVRVESPAPSPSRQNKTAKG